MAKASARIAVLQGLLGLGAIVVLARSFQVQVLQGDLWAKRTTERRSQDRTVPAARGRIYDRNGRELAVSEEQYRISVALNEVRDTAALRALLPRALHLSVPAVDAVFREHHPYFYGPFSAEQVEKIRRMRGIHFDVLYNRVYPMQSLADRVLGRLDQEGKAGIEGIEKSVDTLLRGEPGEEHFLLDARGNVLRLPGGTHVAPITGRDVTLTIDADLQGIAEGALRSAVESDNALGGDIVIIDVRTGELLALASLRMDSVSRRLVSTASAIVEPNEPGSTSKIFTIAAILRSGVDTTPVQGEGGKWLMNVGRGAPRPINDEHKLSGPVTLGETVKYSSNIAISKFSIRLTRQQQFDAIRDFGFGTPPALGFPGESPGTLHRPSTWVNPLLTQPSLGQGYEWEASAVQLATGYAAIANHGFLMAPSLVREVRDGHRAVVWTHHPDTVRRAIPDSVARRLISYLALATDSGGTGSRAQLDRLHLVGKTGTAQRRHVGGGYRASFVAIFPEENPQAVIYVMIDRPSNGHIFGGEVAAPIVHTVVQQALATISSPLDRSKLAAGIHIEPLKHAVFLEPVEVHTVALPIAPAIRLAGNEEIPDLAGRPVRDAVEALERAGFAVRLTGRAHVRTTTPAAGDSAARGSVVTIHADSLP